MKVKIVQEINLHPATIATDHNHRLKVTLEEDLQIEEILIHKTDIATQVATIVNIQTATRN